MALSFLAVNMNR